MARPTREELITFDNAQGGSNTKLLQRILNAFVAMVSGKNENGTDFALPVEVVSGNGGGGAAPENEEVVALASARDTTGGRTSDALVNRYGRGIAVLVDATEVRGTGALVSVIIENAVGDGWVLSYQFDDIAVDGVSVKKALFLFNVDGAGTLGIARKYRVRTVVEADNAGNDITYSVTVCHLL